MPLIYSVTVLSNRSIIQHHLHVCHLLPRCYHAPLCSGLTVVTRKWVMSLLRLIATHHTLMGGVQPRCNGLTQSRVKQIVQSLLNLTAVLSISCFELTVVPQSTNTNMPITLRQRRCSAAGFDVHGWNNWERIQRIFINDTDIDNYLNCQL